ncbi:MAG: dihydroneopterin aldolase [Paludibacteraceae bacterium]
MAKIVLKNMEFYAYHGCYAAERNIGGTYLVSVTIDTDLTTACHSDSVCDTINYETVYQIVKKEMQQPSNLIEHVAYRIRATLLAEFDAIDSVVVEISKLAPPLGGKTECAMVIID